MAPQGTILPRGHPDRFKPTTPTAAQVASSQERKRERENEKMVLQATRSMICPPSSRSFSHVTVKIPPRGRSNVSEYFDEALRISEQGVYKLEGSFNFSKGLAQPPYVMTTKQMSKAEIQAYYRTATFDFKLSAYRMPEWLKKIGARNAALVANIRVSPIYYSYCRGPDEEDGDWREVLAARRSLRRAQGYFKGKRPLWPRPGVVKCSLWLEGSDVVWTSDPERAYREWYASQGKKIPDKRATF